ncbi:hypothetical protein ACIBCD_05645 [Nocardia brasiliensis]|uniref:hypothetical protein n=1 Tax=Nocardia brasiliensis TaxID=37326 RepID=UPI00379F230C
MSRSTYRTVVVGGIAVGISIDEGTAILARNTEFSRRLLLSVDAVGYGSGDDQRQRAVQTGLLSVLDHAAAEVGLDRSSWAKQQAGDSELAILPADQSQLEPVIVDDFTRELHTALTGHNEDLCDDARLRLRLAVHFGAAAPADNGFAGKGVVVVSRLVECRQVKKALRVVQAADLAVILSKQVYGDVVVPRYSSLRTTAFREIAVQNKEFRELAYLLLPGHDISSIDLEPSPVDHHQHSAETHPAADDRGPESGAGQRQATVTNTINGDVTVSHGVIGMVWNQ